MPVTSWTKKQAMELTRLRLQKLTYAEIGLRMGKSADMVMAKAFRLGLSDNNKFNTESPFAMYDLKKWTVLHLLDLKRAGHSPRFTEFKITPERITPISRPASGSGCGSSAGMCVDAGGPV